MHISGIIRIEEIYCLWKVLISKAIDPNLIREICLFADTFCTGLDIEEMAVALRFKEGLCSGVCLEDIAVNVVGPGISGPILCASVPLW